MTLLVDAAPVVALADLSDTRRSEIEQTLLSERGSLVIPAPVIAEIDYLLGHRIGDYARRPFLDDLAAGRFTVECLEADEYALAVELEHRYEALRLGLADLSLIVLSQRLDIRRLLTFDERHFRAVMPLQGGAFTLLPADA